MSSEHLTVFAGLNQVSAGLNRFIPHVWQKQVFAGRNPILIYTVAEFMFRLEKRFNAFSDPYFLIWASPRTEWD